MSHESIVKKLDDRNFKEGIKKGVVLVDFYADWCGPCRMIAPIIEELAKEIGEKVSFIKVDIENAQEVTSEHNITSIPTLLLMKDGAVVQRVVGLKDKNSLKKLIEAAL